MTDWRELEAERVQRDPAMVRYCTWTCEHETRALVTLLPVLKLQPAHRYDTCPECGGQKRRESQVCATCAPRTRAGQRHGKRSAA